MLKPKSILRQSLQFTKMLRQQSTPYVSITDNVKRAKKQQKHLLRHHFNISLVLFSEQYRRLEKNRAT